MTTMTPCPFCGSDKVVKAKEMQSNEYSTYASCENCGAEGPFSRHDPSEANAKWNTRKKQAMTPTSKLHKHVFSESLWVRLADAEAIEKELIETQSENTRLRAAIAQGTSACIYCSLPKEQWSKCKSGFPGCVRGDDAIGCPELGASYYLSEMEGNRNEWKKVASLYRTACLAELEGDLDLFTDCRNDADTLYENLSQESQAKS